MTHWWAKEEAEVYRSRMAANERAQDAARQAGLHLRTTSDLHRESELWQAAACGDSSAVHALISQGSELNWRNRFGVSVIHAASQHGDFETVRLLLEHKALISARDGTEATPLHYAAEYGSCTVIRNLLLAKSEPDSRDVFGATPLHYAAQMGHFDIVMFLLCNSADATLEDCQGRTAQDRARSSGRETRFEAALKGSRRDPRKEREKREAEQKAAQEALERRQRLEEERALLEMEQALRQRLAAERKANELQALREEERARQEASARQEAEEDVRRKKQDEERWRAAAAKNCALSRMGVPEQPQGDTAFVAVDTVLATTEQVEPAWLPTNVAETALPLAVSAHPEGFDPERRMAARQQLLLDLMLNPKRVGASFRQLEALAATQDLDALSTRPAAQEPAQEAPQEEALQEAPHDDPSDSMNSSRRSSLRTSVPPRLRPSILTRCSTPYGALLIKSQVPPKQLGSLRDSFQRASGKWENISQLEACTSPLQQVGRVAAVKECTVPVGMGTSSGNRLLLQPSVMPVMGREVVDAVDDGCFD
jgi:hypothetical protein